MATLKWYLGKSDKKKVLRDCDNYMYIPVQILKAALQIKSINISSSSTQRHISFVSCFPLNIRKRES